MEHQGSTFISGCYTEPGFFYFAKELDELINEGTSNSSFFRFRDVDKEAQFRKFNESVGWPAISMATIKKPETKIVIAISPYGDFWELESVTTKQIVSKISGFEGNLRNIVAIDGVFFACGMNREILKRIDAENWLSFGPETLQNEPTIIGFENMSGYSLSEMYAVGWNGEIWWYNSDNWNKVNSPTSSILSSLTCASDGFVYIVGQDGILIKGRYDNWELVETGRYENLKDVAYNNGVLYVCSDFGLFKLEKTGLVDETNFEDTEDKPLTCLYLLETSTELVSLGLKDVFVKKELNWERLV